MSEYTCVECKSKYRWLGDNMVALPDDEYICLYCYYGEQERMWTTEWELAK